MTRSIFLAVGLAAGVGGVLLVGCLAACAPTSTMHAPNPAPATVATHPSGDPAMKLGNFSVSLAVKDIAASRAFYEKLGFEMTNGDGKKWVVLQNGAATIGLFQGMFERNMLTFNPGWDSNKATLPDFEDVRELQKTLKARGLTPNPAADESTTGPAFLMLTDPDGNPILIDQHVSSPANPKK